MTVAELIETLKEMPATHVVYVNRYAIEQVACYYGPRQDGNPSGYVNITGHR